MPPSSRATPLPLLLQFHPACDPESTADSHRSLRMPKFSRHSSRCHVPTSGGPRPFGASPHPWPAADGPTASCPTECFSGSAKSPSQARQLLEDESKFRHPPPSLPAADLSHASGESTHLNPRLPASWVIVAGLIRAMTAGAIIQCIGRRVILRGPAAGWHFKVWHGATQRDERSCGLSGRRVVIRKSRRIPRRNHQIRHRPAEGDQSFCRHSLDVKVQRKVHQFPFVRHATVGRRVCDQIIV